MLIYAWFVNNTKVTATDVTVTATTAYSLQIKHYKSGAYGTTTPLNNANVHLVPVSTVGGNNENIAFFKSENWDKDGNVITFSDATVTNVNNETDNNLASVGYASAENPGSAYYVDTVYLKAGQTSKLYFDAASTGLIDSTTSAFKTFGSSTNDVIKALRVGVLVSDEDGTNGKFFVYQLNSDATTAKSNTTATTLTAGSADGLKAGVVSTTDTANFDANKIVTFESNTLPLLDNQCATASANSLASVDASIKPLYNFSVTGTNDKAVCKVVIYLWMEGCDYDTVAANTVAFSTFADKIQFGFCLGK